MNCVGLFGTCGGSLWRDKFEEYFNFRKINYFNPVVEDWKPEDAAIEAQHLADDNIVLFPVTSETYGVGSLSEIGFGILNAIKLDDRRDFIVMIDMELDASLMPKDGWKDLDESSDEYDIEKEVFERAKESLRARALVLEHLKKLNIHNIYLVDDMDEMFKVSIMLWEANEHKKMADKYSIKNKG